MAVLLAPPVWVIRATLLLLAWACPAWLLKPPTGLVDGLRVAADAGTLPLKGTTVARGIDRHGLGVVERPGGLQLINEIQVAIVDRCSLHVVVRAGLLQLGDCVEAAGPGDARSLRVVVAGQDRLADGVLGSNPGLRRTLGVARVRGAPRPVDQLVDGRERLPALIGRLRVMGEHGRARCRRTDRLGNGGPVVRGLRAGLGVVRPERRVDVLDDRGDGRTDNRVASLRRSLDVAANAVVLLTGGYPVVVRLGDRLLAADGEIHAVQVAPLLLSGGAVQVVGLRDDGAVAVSVARLVLIGRVAGAADLGDGGAVVASAAARLLGEAGSCNPQCQDRHSG